MASGPRPGSTVGANSRILVATASGSATSWK